MNNIYCSAPWTGVTIREDGLVRTCCAGSEVLIDLNRESIDNIESSPVLEKIRKKMLDGKADERNCKTCLEREKNSGVAPLREYYLRYYPVIDYTQISPSIIDVRWNNTCNLGCVYCGPHFSSTWANRLEIVSNLRPKRDYHDELLKWILDRADHVREIMLVGGEPMLMKQNYSLFDHLQKNCKISIITNLSYDLKSLPCMENLLNRPAGNVLWNISAENICEKFEYIRNGANWNQFEKNLEFLSEKFPDTITLLIVYFMLSAFDLPETIKEYMNYGIKKISLQPISKNNGMDVFTMPESIRKLAAEKLNEASEYHSSMIHPDDRELYRIDLQQNILDKLLSSTQSKISTREEVYHRISYYDQWNSKKFESLWPNLKTLFDYHLT